MIHLVRPLNFADLRSANVRRNKEWDRDNRLDASFRGLELAGEVGELCNVVKKMERERMGLRGSRATLLQFAEELGDCQICLDLLGMHYSIALDEAVKITFNAKSEEHGFLTRIR